MRIEEAAKLAKLLSSKKNICVEMDANGRAWTDLRGDKYVIGLPVPADGRMDKYIHGYLDHETGHVKWTDFEEVKSLSWQVKETLNIYEDEYVERKMGELYPGAKDNLRELALKVFDCKVPPFLKDALQNNEVLDIDSMHILANYTLLYTRRARLVPEFASHAQNMRKILLAKLGDDTLAESADKLLDEECNSTQDSKRLACLWSFLMDKYEKLIPQLEAQENNKNSNEQESGDSSPGEEAGDDDAEDTTGDDQDNASNRQRAGKAGGDKSVQDIIESLEEASDNEFVSEVGDAMTKTLGMDSLSNYTATTEMEIFNTQNGYEVTRYNKCDWSKGRGNLRDSISVMAARITRTLIPLLQHESYKPARPDYSGKALAKRRLYKVPTGCSDVFMTKAIQRQVDTDIKILCDISYSMDEKGKMDMAALGLLAIYKALNGQRGITVEVGYFDHNFSMADDADLRKYITVRPSGYTEMGKGMLKTLGKFRNPHKRKIMIVLTDGETSDVRLACAAIRMAMKDGVEIYGLGMMSSALDGYHMPHVNVYKSSEIPDAMVSLLKNAMIKRRAA